MELIVQRAQGDAESTPGQLTIDGQFYAFTLEPRKDQSQGKPYCIPAGRYQLKNVWSNHFQTVVPGVQNVPGFEAVEIHPGNFPQDTHGCLLVGFQQFKDEVLQSRTAWEGLMEKLTGQSDIWITYRDFEEGES